MTTSITIVLSVPNLAERGKDCLEDLAATLPGYAGARVDVGRVCVEMDVFSRAAQPNAGAFANVVRRIVPDAHVTEFGPDVLTLDAISQLIGLPATSLPELQAEYPESFPGHVFQCPGHWHLAEVLCWVRAVGAIAIDDDLLQAARLASSLNASMQADRMRRIA